MENRYAFYNNETRKVVMFFVGTEEELNLLPKLKDSSFVVSETLNLGDTVND